MTTPYATVDDLHAYLGTDPPADSQRLLARAQDLLDAVLNTSNFATDTNGNPTDALVVAAFNDAVCAQVEWWIANGDEFDQQNQYQSFSIEGISVSRGVGSTPGSTRPRLCDRAQDVLSSVPATTTFGRPLIPGKPVV